MQFDEVLGNLGKLTERMLDELKRGGLNNQEAAVVVHDNVLSTAVKPMITVPSAEKMFQMPNGGGLTPQQKYQGFIKTERGMELSAYRADVLKDTQRALGGNLPKEEILNRINLITSTISNALERGLQLQK